MMLFWGSWCNAENVLVYSEILKRDLKGWKVTCSSVFETGAFFVPLATWHDTGQVHGSQTEANWRLGGIVRRGISALAYEDECMHARMIPRLL